MIEARNGWGMSDPKTVFLLEKITKTTTPGEDILELFSVNFEILS